MEAEQSSFPVFSALRCELRAQARVGRNDDLLVARLPGPREKMPESRHTSKHASVGLPSCRTDDMLPCAKPAEKEHGSMEAPDAWDALHQQRRYSQAPASFTPRHNSPASPPSALPSSMAKRLFHSCLSPSSAAVVTPSTTLLAKQQSPVVPPPAGACCPRGLPRRRPQPPETCGAGGCAVDYTADDLPHARGTPAYRWLKSSRWHVIEAAATDGDDTPRLKIDARRRMRRSRRRCRRRMHRKAALASLSSGDSGWFSSDEEEPNLYSRSGGGGAEAMVTSTATETSSGASGSSSVARDAMVSGSFAVVKRSDDPRADFRQSMAEMVVGRRIYDADGLERLLRCFLALNDQRHRRDIVDAFGDVWESVFSNPPCHGNVTSQPARRCKAAATSHH